LSRLSRTSRSSGPARLSHLSRLSRLSRPARLSLSSRPSVSFCFIEWSAGSTLPQSSASLPPALPPLSFLFLSTHLVTNSL
jgi:hypothetical protein